LQVAASYGIKRIIYEEVYDKDDLSLTLAGEWGIELLKLSTETERKGYFWTKEFKI
jgi:hypothetical protein